MAGIDILLIGNASLQIILYYVIISQEQFMLVTEYLATHYRPDREYLDGILSERNVGELDHSRMLRDVLYHFRQHERTLGLQALPTLRMRVSPTRIRVPDVIVVKGMPREQVLSHSPFLCIEILSPEDSMSSMQERIDDYLAFGVENIWIIDPRRKKAFWADETGIHQSPDGILRTTNAAIQMDLDPMWPQTTNPPTHSS